MNARGLSLIELLVALAVGLLVLTGALALMAEHTRHAQRTMLGVRLDRDLQALRALVVHEVRRAGHAAEAARADTVDTRTTGVDVDGGTLSAPYGERPQDANRDRPTTSFRVSGGVLQMRRIGLDGSSGWQSVTDPAIERVGAFEVTVQTVRQPAGYACPCPLAMRCEDVAASADDAAQIVQQRVDLHLSLHARLDASIERELRDTVVVRRATLEGHCP